jgi:hypothetical protein
MCWTGFAISFMVGASFGALMLACVTMAKEN